MSGGVRNEGGGRPRPRSRRKRVVETTTRTDWAALRWLSPIRVGLVAGLAVALALMLVDSAFAIPVGLGSFFVGLCDQRGDFADRVRGMSVALLLLLATTFLGLAVSESFPVHLVVAGLLAAFLGYIGLAGPRAALAGVVALVNFTVFAGTPEPIGNAGPAMLGVLLGGGLQVLTMALPLLLRRIGGLRTDISVALRSVAYALRGFDGGPASTNAIGKLFLARRLIDAGGVLGTTRDWCEGMVEAADRIRLAFFSLEGGRNLGGSVDQAAIEELSERVADLLFAVALALELPATRRRVGPRLARTREALARAAATLPAPAAAPLREVSEATEALVRSVEGAWPIGLGRAEVRLRTQFNLEWARDLVRFRDPDRLFTRHAIRLAILIVVATAIAEYAPSTHTYWLPLTVAWITKPDLSGTAERVIGRIAGTMLGLAVFGAIALTVGPNEPVMLALFAVGVLVSVAWLPANYAVCVAGWTPAVLALISLDFPEVTELIGPRLVETILGGALVIAVATIWPTRMSRGLGRGLAMAARALGRYGEAIASDHREGRVEGRISVMAERVAAAMLVHAAAHEPPGSGEALRYEQAQQVLDSLVEASAIAAAVDQASPETVPESGQITDRSLERLDLLADHLDGDGGQEAAFEAPADRSKGGSGKPESEFEHLVEEACRAAGAGGIG